jgi:hypothetical protein
MDSNFQYASAERWLGATDLLLPPTVKRRSAGRPPPMARPRSEAGRVRPARPRRRPSTIPVDRSASPSRAGSNGHCVAMTSFQAFESATISLPKPPASGCFEIWDREGEIDAKARRQGSLSHRRR